VDHRSKRWSRASLRQRVRQTEMMRFLVHGEVRTLTAASIRYVLANAVVSSTVVGARTPGQISDVAEAAKGPPYLPDEDLMRIPQVLAASGA
jgi:aryl-alcohol dehydrogenase-like predicted oxidoreductase